MSYQRYREIRDFLPNHYAQHRAVGLPSDDTQLCAWAIELILDHGAFDPDRYQGLIAERRIFGIGSTVRATVQNRHPERHWLDAAQNSAGNGALMRAAGIFAGHLTGDGAGLAADAALFAATTHNNCTAISSAVAFTLILADLLKMKEAPAQEWWVERYLELARPLEGASRLRPRNKEASFFVEGSLCEFAHRLVPDAIHEKSPTVQICDRWWSGAYLLETLPCVLLILARHGHDPEEAIVRAVNDTRDNDTVAAIVGSAVGTLHGEDSLPRRWRDQLTGRTQDADDGRLFELIAAVERRAELS